MDKQPDPSQEHEQPDQHEQRDQDQQREERAEQPVSAEAELAKLQAERDELQSQLLRAFADYQNYVRRSQNDTVVAREQQTMDIAKALVTVLDHFDKALEVDLEKTSAASLFEGMKIVRDELLKVLERFGVTRLDVEPDEEFDPRRHEALMRQKVEGIQSNHVAVQLQPGYMLNDKTLRPAKVSVAE